MKEMPGSYKFRDDVEFFKSMKELWSLDVTPCGNHLVDLAGGEAIYSKKMESGTAIWRLVLPAGKDHKGG
jgi:hypothetical protein